MARRLRAENGMSIKAIAQALGVSTSSVSIWVRDVTLTDAQIEALRAANPIYNNQLRGQQNRAASARRLRDEWQRSGRRRAQDAEPLHQLGCMLYWAEGSKRRNGVTLTNSDPDLLRVFLRFLRDCYSVQDDRVALSVNVHLGNGLSIEDVHAYWLRTLGLPAPCLRKPTIVTPSTDALRRRKLPYGTARLCVNSTELVQSIYGAIQEYAGFERPEWLD